MNLNRTELKKIMYDFNSVSNRLLQADFADYNGILIKFLNYINQTPIIKDYIEDCGACDSDLEQEFKEVLSSYGRKIFYLGDTDDEEVSNIYAILSYIAKKNIEIHYGLAWGYSTSKTYQDKVKGFNERVVKVLITHIERYLTKIGIDMGLDEKTTYTITVHNGQVNVANDNATISAVNNCDIDREKLMTLISEVQKTAQGLSSADAETVSDSLEVIKEETKSEHPKRGLLRTAITGIKAIKGTAEFGAAVISLAKFLAPLLGGVL